jgi:hypothetical protein
MDAKELRIGNWVHHNDNWSYKQPDIDFKEFDWQWDDRDWYALGECTLDMDDVYPIPLTEEWLLKFGFEKRDGKYYLSRYLIKEGISQFFDNGMSFRITTSNTESTHAASIKSVHQLQNLYFALTNTELTIK